ncbi:MAG: SCO family protein [Piscinibacter sp.]|uniref:SCO family protein n=1 Tax=Piscinibacter sp. TaxID=1903157 RepID=UPI00258843CA|nr:SCO family protein [Piscinibacter sp.]MCW5664773.1 SCO family protein [Piscinibacter sp.]
MSLRRRALLAAALAPAAVRAAGDAPGTARRPDPSRLPAPGQYTLPRLFAAPDGTLLDPDARSVRLHRLLRGRLSVVSFVYSYCRDPDGCPRAWAVLEAVQAALRADAALARDAQLLSISFDPTHDTPAQLRLLAAGRAGDAQVRWQFLTAPSVRALLPILAGFGQDVSVETDAAGRPTRTLNHLLKLFLVDAALQVREVYGVATLASEAVLNDLRTLQREAAAARP